MVECFKCGMPDTRTVLEDAISNEGIVKICRKCSGEESLPLVRIQSVDDAKEVEAKMNVHDGLEGISGVQPQKVISKGVDLDEQEFRLRNIVERNFAERVPKTHGDRVDMIKNFHWILMRARRSMKLTQKQLADAISEPEKAVRAAERGVLPEKDYTLVKKLEIHLGVNIFNQDVREKVQRIQPGKLDLKDEETTKMLTIDDLREMKRKKESERMAPEMESEIPRPDDTPITKRSREGTRTSNEDDLEIDISDEEVEGMDEDIDFEEKDLTQEEINNLIFGRKKEND